MNIFALSDCPEQAAKWQVDKHCVKMPTETAQILCGVYRIQNLVAPYKLTHKNHPNSLWARTSCSNYDWLIKHGKALCDEYTSRYKRRHACQDIIEWCEKNSHELAFDIFERTPFALAMPDEYKTGCRIQSYRNYYKFGKTHLHQWKQNKPNWI